jgi:hypothetical protein
LLYGVEEEIISWLRISLGLEALSVTSESYQQVRSNPGEKRYLLYA